MLIIVEAGHHFKCQEISKSSSITLIFRKIRDLEEEVRKKVYKNQTDNKNIR